MKAFFDTVRAKFGPLSQSQVVGLTAIFEATKHLPLRHQAYVLATAWHETGPASHPLHMTPRREVWGPTKAQAGYEGRKDLGNTLKGDGKKFAGRGYCQITGRANYQKASTLVGEDLVASPDLALRPDIAARVLVDGMTRGWFTTRKMADFIAYKDMRKVVNGTDDADLIAGYAATFERALIAAFAIKPQPAPPPPPPDVEPGETLPPKAAPKPGAGPAKVIMVIIAAAMALLGAWMTGLIGK